MEQRDETACPACGEMILATAKKCKHCGEWLSPHESAAGAHPPTVTPDLSPPVADSQVVVTVQRPYAFAFIEGYLAWKVLLDGALVGKLDNGKSIVLSVSQGLHTLQVEGQGYSSCSYTLDTSGCTSVDLSVSAAFLQLSVSEVSRLQLASAVAPTVRAGHQPGRANEPNTATRSASDRARTLAELDSEGLAVLRSAQNRTNGTCLDCGYQGPMPVLKSRRSWARGLWIYPVSFFVSCGIVPSAIDATQYMFAGAGILQDHIDWALVFVVVLGISLALFQPKRLSLKCPSCKHLLETA